MSLDSLQDGISSAISGAKQLFSNPITSAIGGAVVGGTIVGTTVALASKTPKKRAKTTTKKSKSRKQKNYKYARTAGKGRDTSRKKIRMTKNGQPYVILASGKARFISKSSARRSRKTKGGRY